MKIEIKQGSVHWQQITKDAVYNSEAQTLKVESLYRHC